MQKENNLAFIDGQNLHLGTWENGWRVSFSKFKIYLKENYDVDDAFYFLGYVSEQEQDLYDNLQKAGFLLIFKSHNKELQAKKKGNVDTDIVFEVMRSLIDNANFNKIILVSGDGDYRKVVDYLIRKDKFKKILFPNKRFASSLYKDLGSELFDYLDNIKNYIQHKK